MLVDHADPLPGLAEPVFAERAQVHPVDGDRAAVRALQHVDAAQQRALAGAAAAEDSEDLPLAHGQVDAVHRDDVTAAAAVRLVEAVDADHRADVRPEKWDSIGMLTRNNPARGAGLSSSPRDPTHISHSLSIISSALRRQPCGPPV
ncbi:hypothetical protein Phou_057680 [Phytohabitans houttuyneae]|uniref:Uncharacterized protein n=1 Tax=Phytohabitans houttuyneae TaxID=1076126 RepID=A0A6V8KGR3_9ACTN|nr:hypothetical protein Phou_057680 [Phytohabitans houttuyneae]